MNALKRRWKLVPLAAVACDRGRVVVTTATARSSADADQDRASCPTVRARSARSTTRTSQASSPRCRSSPAAHAEEPRTIRVTAGPAASINGHPLVLVGVGCSNDKADTAIKETKRLMEQLKADIMIGPLSGDESIAVANYAKQHPTKTFVDGAAGAQDTTLKVRAPNFFRFNGDGAMWNAGLGDLAYNKLGWRTAAVVADDYSFAWTSAAGFIAEFCAVGGKVTKRVFPPLEHDRLLVVRPADADERRRHVRRGRRCRADPVPEGLRAGARADRRQEVHRQPVLGHPGAVRAALARASSGAYFGGAGTAGDLATPAAKAYNAQDREDVQDDPAVRRRGAAGVVDVHLRLLHQHVGPAQGPQGRRAATSPAARRALQTAIGKVKLATPYGPLHLDKNRQAVINVFYGQLITKGGKLAIEDGRRDPGRRPDVRRHVLDRDARSGTHLPEVRQAEPAVDRQERSPDRSRP